MTEDEFQKIEHDLGVHLPKAYKDLMPEFERLSTKQKGHLCLYQSAAQVVDANKEARDFARMGWQWPDRYLIVGDNGGGDVFCLDLSDPNDTWVWRGDHECGQFSRFEEIAKFVESEIEECLDDMFAVIPVIDVRHGQAVRAVRGERSNYRPILTPLAATADPVDVARGYLNFFPFRTFYVADLDGIEGRGKNVALPERLHALTKGPIWVDDGSSSIVSSGSIKQVLGSESLAGGLPTGSRNSPDWILSLDFRGHNFVGPPAVLQNDMLWPGRVIVMTLARVGSGNGPDFALLAGIASRAGGARKVFAAGGVRHAHDLRVLRDTGIAGALIASALHSGSIEAGDLCEIAGL